MVRLGYKGIGRLFPSPRQVLFLVGFGYMVLGYLSGSCVRLVAGLVLVGLSFFWDIALAGSRYFGYLPKFLQTVFLGGGTILYFFSVGMLPAQAFFLGKLCGLMSSVVDSMGTTGTGGETIKNLIRATVNVVRALFILYLAIALVGVFNQMQRDEEWQVAARTPLLALIIVGIIEGISALIVSNSVTTC